MKFNIGFLVGLERRMALLPVMGWHCDERASRCGRTCELGSRPPPTPGGSDVAGKLKDWPSWSGGGSFIGLTRWKALMLES